MDLISFPKRKCLLNKWPWLTFQLPGSSPFVLLHLFVQRGTGCAAQMGAKPGCKSAVVSPLTFVMVMKLTASAPALQANASELMDAAILLCITAIVFSFVLYNLCLPLAPMFLGLVFT